ncbi:MAG: HAMP domain-containing sensor histidine kinase [Proteobacteria bacterium]|nr:HAMP domain-containing sensor histidine kinase [Pseudomonadota bacterium]
MQNQKYNTKVLKRKIITQFAWVFHPISIFVAMQILSITLISLWVVWFLGRQRDIDELSNRIGNAAFTNAQAYSAGALVGGIIALLLVLVGSVLLFIWGQKQASIIRQQRSFVSSVTHELRTPLASMHLAHETLMTRNLNDETRNRLLSMSLADIERLTRLVNQILISSRLDRGLAMFQDDIKLIKIKSRIEEILAGLLYLDENLKKRTIINCLESVQIRFSDNAFNLIVGNIIENAIKYSAKNSEILINVSQEDTYLHVSVKDQGIGISRKDIKKVFRMFYRSNITSKKAIPGTGLGLFIVKTSLDQLGGKISVSSEGPGTGSTFKIMLPLD